MEASEITSQAAMVAAKQSPIPGKALPVCIEVWGQSEGQRMPQRSYHITDLMKEIYWGGGWLERLSLNGIGREEERERQNDRETDRKAMTAPAMVAREMCRIW